MGGKGRKQATVARTAFWFCLKAVVLFFLYVFTAKAGLALQAVGNYAAPVWPPTGLAIAFVFLWGESFAPVVFLAASYVNFRIVGAPLPVALLLGFGNAGEAFAAAALLRRFGFRPAFDRVRDVIVYLAAAIAGPLVSATIGTTTLWIAGLAAVGYAPIWINWWIGDVLGAIVVAPVIILFATLGWFSLPKWRKLEALLLVAAICALDYGLFVGPVSGDFAAVFLVIAYSAYGWAAIRFGTRGATLATLITSGFAVAGAVTKGQSGSLLVLQAFLATIALPFLLIAALSEERRRSREEIEQLNRDLKGKVSRQTASLLAAKERDEAIMESLGEGLIVIDPKGRITAMNPVAKAMMGLQASKVEGKAFDEITRMETANGQVVNRRSRPLQRTLIAGKGIEISSMEPAYYVRPDGTRFPSELTTAPIRSEGKLIGAVQVFRDVSKIQELNRAKSEFVALASHQLRTPTTSIRWYSDLLLEDKDLSKKNREQVRAVRDSAVRMADIVTVLLGVSQVDLGTFVPKAVSVDLKRLVNDIVADEIGLIEMKKVKVEKKFSGKLADVHLEAGVMRVAVENLLSNAIKYSPEGATVSLTVERGQKAVTVTVADRGSGIPLTEQPKIFTKFYRAANARLIDPDGNGLGLYLSKTMLERVGGSITFRSELDRGSTFVATVPIV